MGLETLKFSKQNNYCLYSIYENKGTHFMKKVIISCSNLRREPRRENAENKIENFKMGNVKTCEFSRNIWDMCNK